MAKMGVILINHYTILPLFLLCSFLNAESPEKISQKHEFWNSWLTEKPGQWPMSRYYQSKPPLFDRWVNGKELRRTRLGDLKPPENRSRFPLTDTRNKAPLNWRMDINGGAPRYSFAQDRRRREIERPPYLRYPEFVYRYNSKTSPWIERYPPKIHYRRFSPDVRLEEVRTDVEGQSFRSWSTD